MEPRRRFAPQAEEVLRTCGWFEGRNVEGSLALPGDFRIFPAASSVLAEFGGLRGGHVGPGIDTATSDFDLRPSLAWGESDRFQGFEEQLGVRLYPLGEAHHSHVFLAIADGGQTFLVMDDVFPLGSDFHSGLENLILGKRPR